MPRDRRTLFAWLGTLLVVVLCLIPKRAMPVSEATHAISHTDKLVHLAMFAFLGLLWTFAGRGPAWISSAKVFVVVVVLAVGTELAQGLPMIERDPDRYDALADVIGGAIGIGLALAARGWIPLNSHPDLSTPSSG